MPDKFESTLQIQPLLKKVEFFGRHLGAFGRLWRPNAIWCNMRSYTNHFFSLLRIFYVDMTTSEGGGPVYP